MAERLGAADGTVRRTAASARHAVLAFDHVAHGAAPASQASLPVMIRTVEQIINAVPRPVGVIGHSLVPPRSRRSSALVAASSPPSNCTTERPTPVLMALARMLKAPGRLMLPIQRAAERIAKVEMKRLVADTWTVRRIRAPLLIVPTWMTGKFRLRTATPIRRVANACTRTDGLGHRRILRDMHVVDRRLTSSRFASRCRAQQLLIAA